MSNNWADGLKDAKEQINANKGSKTESTYRASGNKQDWESPFVVAANGLGIPKDFNDGGDGGVHLEAVYQEAANLAKGGNENPRSKHHYSVFKVNKETYGLEYSSVAIATMDKERENSLIAYTIVLIESTGETPTPIRSTNYGMEFLVIRPPSLTINDHYYRAVEDTISLGDPKKLERLRSVGKALFVREFKHETDKALTRFLSPIFNSIRTEIHTLYGGKMGGSIASFASRQDARFAVDTAWNNQGVMYIDPSDQPIRQDICLRLSTKIGKPKNNNDFNDSFRSENIINVYGYIDFNHEKNKQAFLGNGMRDTRCFVPNFVITDMTSETSQMTLNLFFLGLISLFTLSENNHWVNSFLSRAITNQKGVVDANDICLLNVQANVLNDKSGFGMPLDRKEAGFNANTIKSFVEATCFPGMTFSIDVPDAGPNNWFLSQFDYIYANNPNAIKRVASSLGELTNGTLNTMPAPMFVKNANRLYGGYYVDNGEKVDLRKATSYLSFVAHVINTNQPLGLIDRYIATFENEQIPVDLRAAYRHQMTNPITRETSVIKYNINRYMFGLDFLTLVREAFSLQGFAPLNESMLADQDIFQSRGFNYGSAMVSASTRVSGTQTFFGGNNWNGFGNQYQHNSRFGNN